MSKEVLISIRPKWCDLILSGKKSIEIRKTRPKLETPFKCYIYCTKPRWKFEDFLFPEEYGTASSYGFFGGGKVIGEFVCDFILPVSIYVSDETFFETASTQQIAETCLTDKEIMTYLGNGKTGYGWHISDLVIYAEPKELNEFCRWYEDGDDIRPCQNGKSCEYSFYDYSEDCEACSIDYDGTDCPFLKVTRPPQSWCYVED